jgi:hypothetical protein
MIGCGDALDQFKSDGKIKGKISRVRPQIPT